jgi:anti-sigma B factor antagonist
VLVTAAPDEPFPSAVTVHVSGEIDMNESDQLCDVIVASTGPAITTVVIDLTGVTFFGSAGISALIAARRILLGRGQRFCVDECSEMVERVLESTGMRDHLPRSDAFGGTV